MATAFSVASWNVKHFMNDPDRVGRVTEFLKDQNPDVFALYEVTGKEIFKAITESFTGYTFQITEGSQTQQILVGFRSNITAFITQRIEYKSGATYMRPGQLTTITIDGVNYSLLFLHLASSNEPRGLGLRDDMLSRAVKFRHVLDKATGGMHTANYIFLGDLNIMGMEYPFDKEIKEDLELKKWDQKASQYFGMRKLKKTHTSTWSGGSASTIPDSDLDHVFAAKHLLFKHFQNSNNIDVDVSVRGWVDTHTAPKKDQWIADYSDHSLLYFEVQKVNND